MYNLLLADDEIVMRTALETMVDWEAEGFRLQGCCANGRAALEIMKDIPIDLVLTDMKMPVCDGLGLIDGIHASGQEPVILVLSAFDDFPLVKQAFRKGATDYILKQELSPEKLTELLREARKLLDAQRRPAALPARPAAPDISSLMRDVILGNASPEALPGLEDGYVLACFFVDDLYREMSRLGSDIQSTLIDPMNTLLRQMPLFRPCDGFCSFDASRHFMLYSLAPGNRSRKTALSMFAALKKAWKTYLNIDCTAGMAYGEGGAADFQRALEQAEINTTLRYVLGPGGIYDDSFHDRFDPVAALHDGQNRLPLIRAAIEADQTRVENEQALIARELQSLPIGKARQRALFYLFNLYYEMGFIDVQIAYKLGLEHQLYQRLHAMENHREIMIFFVSVVRKLLDYVAANYTAQQHDPMVKVKQYINANYHRSDLSLAEASSISGYKEKYFCTLFKRRFGLSFTDYLNKVRISAARELLETTSQRVYLISDAVGYRSMEHFMRLFKRETGLTPKAYRIQRQGISTEEDDQNA